MLGVEEIQERLVLGHYRLSRHALKRMVERNISEELIRCSGATVSIIEDYPDDKYSPSCLLLGFVEEEPLHLQVTRNPSPTVLIVTLYIPSLEYWEPGYTRRRQRP
jgi:Domain of unknown function (DUF4258)